MVVVAGFGNPLLDLTVTIHDDTLLNKYNVKADDQKELPPNQMEELLEDIKKLGPVSTPGGSAQNTLRLTQWLLNTPNSTIMYGAIGQDTQGDTLKMLVEEVGVQTRYILQPNLKTGVSVVLINGETRTLLANIGAAQYVQINDLKTDGFLQNVDLVYMEAFFLTSSRVPVAQYVLDVCEEYKILFAFNLSAMYMVNSFTFDVLHFAEQCDVLIGNYDEYNALIQALNLQDDVKSFAIKLTQKYVNRKGLTYGKMCAITNGPQQVLCVHSSNIIEIQEPIQLNAEAIVDTNGAGDAFAAGFLCGLLKDKTPKECTRLGCAVAKEIVLQRGCTIPQNKDNFLECFISDCCKN